MTAEDNRSVPGLEDILSSAVERQVAEQRVLQEALSGIRDAVDGLRHDLAGRSDGPPDATVEAIEGLRADLTGALRDAPSNVGEEISALREGLEEVRALVSGAAREIRELPQSLPAAAPSGPPLDVGRLEERIDELPSALFKGVRDALAPQFEAPSELRDALADLREQLGRAEGSGDLRSALGELDGSVRTASQDVQALAQAMLDLNAGLRDWAGSIEERVSSLAGTLVEGLQGLAAAQKDALDGLGAAVQGATSDLRKEVRGLVKDTTRSLGTRLDGVQEELVQAGQLSRYLRDQSEDLDRALAGLGDVPERLEGVVAQALRRALTVRAGLMREAEKALEGIIGPLEGDLERLVGSVEVLSESLEGGQIDDDLRKLSLHQVELTGRVDGLQETLLGRLEELEDTRSRREELLAKAIDRVGRGQDPGAVDALVADRKKEPKKRRSTSSGAKKVKSPPKASSKRTTRKKTTAKKASQKKAPAKKKTGKSSSRRSKGKGRSSSSESEGGSASGGGKVAKDRSRGRVRTTTRTRNFIPV